MEAKTDFLKDIVGQPSAVCHAVQYYRTDGRDRLRQWNQLLTAGKKVLFSGMGSSEFAVETILLAMAGRGIESWLLDAGEWLHFPRPFDGLPVLISQSGESAETRKLAEKHEGRFVAITNNPQSAIAKHACLNLPMMAGEEASISTKTYANTLAVLHLMAQETQSIDAALDRLERVADSMHAPPQDAIEKAADVLAAAPALQFIGRGPTMAAARESSLAFMEGARIICSALTGGNFRHGPLELSDSSHYCVLFIPQSSTSALMNGLAAELTAKGSHVVVITDQAPSVAISAGAVISIPAHGEALFSLAAASTHARLLEALARRRGLVAGVFRYSGKITATE